MTLASLEIDITIAREIESDNNISELSDSALIALNQDSAKRVLQSDMDYVFNLLEETTTTKLDALIDKYTEEFQMALLYLQFYQYFESSIYRDNEYGLYKADRYKKLYNEEKSKWSRMYAGTSTANTSIINIIRN